MLTSIKNLDIKWKIGIAVLLLFAIWQAALMVIGRIDCYSAARNADTAYADGNFIDAERYYRELLFAGSGDEASKRYCPDRNRDEDNEKLDEVVAFNTAVQNQNKGEYQAAATLYEYYFVDFPQGRMREEAENRISEIHAAWFLDKGKAGKELMLEMYKMSCGDWESEIPAIETILDSQSGPKFWYPGAIASQSEYIAQFPAEFKLAVCYGDYNISEIVETCLYGESGPLPGQQFVRRQIQRVSATYEAELVDTLTGKTVAGNGRMDSKAPGACPATILESPLTGTPGDTILGDPDFSTAVDWAEEKMQVIKAGGAPDPFLTLAGSAELPEELVDAEGAAMRLVPAGEFVMGGKDSYGFHTAEPIHPVYLDAYYIDKYEVTNAMFSACVETGMCGLPNTGYLGSEHYSDPEFADHPVVGVSWELANDYCGWRGAQLPTEAQWEKAARGADALTFPWGDESPDCSTANLQFNLLQNQQTGDFEICSEETARIGSYEADLSPYGVYDMAGNVSEWVADRRDGDQNYYEISPYSNPTGPESGLQRIFRGGSWNRVLEGIFERGTWKYFDEVDRDLGFRCARVISP